MGLAASQARLLLLTARKSDLEYRAQCITQRKLILAMQTEELATNYSKALNQRKLTFTFKTTANQGTSQTVDLTYSQLTNPANFENFRVVDKYGNLVVLNEKDLAKYTDAGTLSDYTVSTGVAAGEEGAEGGAEGGAEEGAAADGTVVTTPIEGTENVVGCTYAYASILNNPDAFQDALQSGVLFIQQLTTTKVDETDPDGNIISSTVANDWQTKTLTEVTNINNVYDTEGTAIAEAEYNRNTLMIQNQDKQLDVELKQVETQQKACESEIDSVKKVLDKNIEKSFKVFA